MRRLDGFVVGNQIATAHREGCEDVVFPQIVGARGGHLVGHVEIKFDGTTGAMLKTHAIAVGQKGFLTVTAAHHSGSTVRIGVVMIGSNITERDETQAMGNVLVV